MLRDPRRVEPVQITRPMGAGPQVRSVKPDTHNGLTFSAAAEASTRPRKSFETSTGSLFFDDLMGSLPAPVVRTTTGCVRFAWTEPECS